jgi:hypothetical protein
MPNDGTVQKQDNDDIGIVYFASNKAMPGYVKIGRTKEDLQGRFDQLNSTNVPYPFDCLYACEVKNHKQVERTLHKILSGYRVENKEFFIVPDSEIIPVQELLALLSIKDVTNTVQQQLELNFGSQPILVEVTDKDKIPKQYKTYQDLKPFLESLLETDDDFSHGLFAYRVAVHHRVKQVPYYRLNKTTIFYDPETFKDEARIEKENRLKETSLANSTPKEGQEKATT